MGLHSNSTLLHSIHKPYLTNEPKVVADQDYTTIKIIDGVSQGVDGLNVQVVGGFIQQQEVRAAKRQPCKNYPTPLSIRQVLNGTDLHTYIRTYMG